MKSDDPKIPEDNETMFPGKQDRKKPDDQQVEPGQKETAGKQPAKEKPFLKMLKKVGFSVWITVMAIGGILAFLTSLLLL